MDINLLLLIVPIFITLGAQALVSFRYKKYSDISNSRGLTGAYAALEVLKNNGLENVYVVETKGYLSDHFDSSQNVIRLSSEVFHGDSISSIAIACHEVGHAIQYKEGNFFIKLRKFIFPLISISSKFGYIAILIGYIAESAQLFFVGIAMLLAIVFFQLITLPVEFDASRRAMSNLEKYGLINNSEKDGVSKVLVAAALTYVAGLITSLIEVFRLILIFGLGDRD